MQRIKKVLLSIMLLFLCIFSCACSQVTYTTSLKSNGAVVQSMDIDLKELKSSKQAVYSIIKTYYNQLDAAYVENVINLFENVYADNKAFAEDTNKSNKFNFIITKNTNYMIGETEETSDRDTGNFSFVYLNKTFASVYAYILYFCPSAFVYDAELDKVKVADDYNSLIDIPLNSTFEEEEGFLYNSYVQTCNPFYYNNEEPKFLYDATIASAGISVTKGQTLVEVLVDATDKTEQDVELIFNFSTPYKRVHSDGDISISGEGTTHSWQLSGVDATIKLWRNYANQTPWYILAGGGTLVCVVIALIVLAIIKNIKKKRGLRALKKIADFELLNTQQNETSNTQNETDNKD